MTPSLDVPLEVVRRSERLDPWDDRRLRSLIAGGHWTRIAPGSFAATQAWKQLTPMARHRVFVLECARRFRPGAVLSHFAAAAVWGIDVLGLWPETVDITIAAASGGRSSGLVSRRTTIAWPPETIPFGLHRITTPAQTALDLARVLPHVRAVSVVDQAIWRDRNGGALTARESIHALWEGSSHRGNSRAMRAIAFADAGAANVRESQSRVLIARLGFPTPRIQERRLLRSGRLVFGDFYFPSHDHWGELDGRGKYLSPEFGVERDVAAIVLDEKSRENEIRREVRGFSRWEPTDNDQPRRLYDILTGDGLPSSLPRP